MKSILYQNYISSPVNFETKITDNHKTLSVKTMAKRRGLIAIPRVSIPIPIPIPIPTPITEIADNCYIAMNLPPFPCQGEGAGGWGHCNTKLIPYQNHISESGELRQRKGQQ